MIVKVIGYAAVVVLAIVVLMALGFLVVALPDVSRYRRLRKM